MAAWSSKSTRRDSSRGLTGVLSKEIGMLYNQFRRQFFTWLYPNVWHSNPEITMVEAFSMEGIIALDKPTISEFASMMQISAPNAAYKIGTLMQKGFLDKVRSAKDHREYHLRPTGRYLRCYDRGIRYQRELAALIRARFPREDCEKLVKMLRVITTELIPELNMKFAEKEA